MLANKQAAFLSKTIATHLIADRQDLQKINVTLKPGRPPLAFESDVSLSSGIVGTSRVFVGRHSYMNDGGYIRGTVFIGRYCSIGRRVTIGAGTHSMVGVSTSSRLMPKRADGIYTPKELNDIGAKQDRPSLPTIIESDVWVGDGAVILPGVKIGTGAVIGANAVVRKDVLPYAIVGGASSTPLRFRFDEAYRELLIASSWWELAHAQLQQLPAGNILNFLREIEEVEKPTVEEPTYVLA